MSHVACRTPLSRLVPGWRFHATVFLTTATGEGRRRTSALVAALAPLFVLLALHPPASHRAGQATDRHRLPSSTASTGETLSSTASPRVCTFAITFHFDQSFPIVGWKVKDWVSGNWKDGKTRLKGQGATDASRRHAHPRQRGSSRWPRAAKRRRGRRVADRWQQQGPELPRRCSEFAEPPPARGEPPDDGEAGGRRHAEDRRPTRVVRSCLRRQPRAYHLPPTDGGILETLDMNDRSPGWPSSGLGALAFVILLLTPDGGLRRRRAL